MKEFLVRIFGKYFGTVIMSFIPLIELKGGIVFARGVGLGFWEALGLAFAGSTLAFFVIFFLFVPLLNLLKKIKFINTFAFKLEYYFKRKAENSLKKHENSKLSEKVIKQLTVFIFVSIPLPLTGVWTGTAVAVFLNLKFKDAILPIVGGNLVAGLLVSGLVELFMAIWNVQVLDYFLWGLLGLALIFLIVFIVKVCKQKPEDN